MLLQHFVVYFQHLKTYYDNTNKNCKISNIFDQVTFKMNNPNFFFTVCTDSREPVKNWTICAVKNLFKKIFLPIGIKPEVVGTLASIGSFKGEGGFKVDSGLRGLWL